MSRPFSRTARCTSAFLLLALPACTITFREKPIEPLDTDRNYAVPLEQCWSATQAVIEDFVPEVKEANFEPENEAGLIVSEFAVLADQGEPVNHLRQVAYARGAPFIGGRYTLTTTLRKVRDGTCKVKVVARIEGYLGEEYGYQVLRSTGLLEETIFERLGTQLGAEPVADSPR